MNIDISKERQSGGVRWQHFISPASFLLACVITALPNGAKESTYTLTEILKTITLIGTASGIPIGIYGIRHGWSNGFSIFDIILGLLIPGAILVGIIVAFLLLGGLIKAGY